MPVERRGSLVTALAGWQHPAWYTLHRCWRELETHHVDLNVGYRTTDWPGTYVTWALDDTLTALAARDFPAAQVDVVVRASSSVLRRRRSPRVDRCASERPHSGCTNTCVRGLRFWPSSRTEFLAATHREKCSRHMGCGDVLLSKSVAVLVPKNFKRLTSAVCRMEALCISGHFRAGHHRGDTGFVRYGLRRNCPEEK